MRTALLFGSVFVALVVSGLARGEVGSDSTTGPLPPPPPGAAAFNSAAPAILFEKLGTQPAAVRTAFQGSGPDNTRVELREIIVGPQALVRLDPLPGPVVISPRSGEGSLRAGDRIMRLNIADVVSAGSGVPLEIQNSSEAPLILKLYLVEVR